MGRQRSVSKVLLAMDRMYTGVSGNTYAGEEYGDAIALADFVTGSGIHLGLDPDGHREVPGNLPERIQKVQRSSPHGREQWDRFCNLKQGSSCNQVTKNPNSYFPIFWYAIPTCDCQRQVLDQGGVFSRPGPA